MGKGERNHPDNVAETGFPVSFPGVVSLKSLKDRVMLTCFPIFPQSGTDLILNKTFLTGTACKVWSKEADPAQELERHSLSGPDKEDTAGSLHPPVLPRTLRLATFTISKPLGGRLRIVQISSLLLNTPRPAGPFPSPFWPSFN